MSLDKAKKAFKEAAAACRSPQDRVLWNMNAGFLHLCATLEEIQTHIAELDRKIVHISRQIGA